jgi:hypothetical protein
MTKIIDFQTSRPIEEIPPGRVRKPLNILELDHFTHCARTMGVFIRDGYYDPETLRLMIKSLELMRGFSDEEAADVYRSLKEAEAAK